MFHLNRYLMFRKRNLFEGMQNVFWENNPVHASSFTNNFASFRGVFIGKQPSNGFRNQPDCTYVLLDLWIKNQFIKNIYTNNIEQTTVEVPIQRIAEQPSPDCTKRPNQ